VKIWGSSEIGIEVVPIPDKTLMLQVVFDAIAATIAGKPGYSLVDTTGHPEQEKKRWTDSIKWIVKKALMQLNLMVSRHTLSSQNGLLASQGNFAFELLQLGNGTAPSSVAPLKVALLLLFGWVCLSLLVPGLRPHGASYRFNQEALNS